MFTGEMMDTNGLEYLRARYYNPVLGVFPSLDFVEFVNRYAYVQGNVVNQVDPSGLCPEWLLGTTLAACAAAVPQPADGGILGDITACGSLILCVGSISIAYLMLMHFIQTGEIADADFFRGGSSGNNEFPCSQGPAGVWQYGPFGVDAWGDGGSGYTPGNALSDLRCHLRWFNGYSFDQIFEGLSTQCGVDFQMRVAPGRPGAAFRYGDGPGGTIYVPQPNGLGGPMRKGTRADRIAEFVEEIVHAAQYHNILGSCTMSWYDSEFEAKASAAFWMSTSRITPDSFKHSALRIVLLAGGVNTSMIDTVTMMEEVLGENSERLDLKSIPAFPYRTPEGTYDFTQAACPNGAGGFYPVPFVSKATHLPSLLTCVDPLIARHISI